MHLLNNMQYLQEYKELKRPHKIENILENNCPAKVAIIVKKYWLPGQNCMRLIEAIISLIINNMIVYNNRNPPFVKKYIDDKS